MTENDCPVPTTTCYLLASTACYVYVCSSVHQLCQRGPAVHQALCWSGDGRPILVTGSLHPCGAIRVQTSSVSAAWWSWDGDAGGVGVGRKWDDPSLQEGQAGRQRLREGMGCQQRLEWWWGGLQANQMGWGGRTFQVWYSGLWKRNSRQSFCSPPPSNAQCCQFSKPYNCKSYWAILPKFLVQRRNLIYSDIMEKALVWAYILRHWRQVLKNSHFDRFKLRRKCLGIDRRLPLSQRKVASLCK